MAVNTRRESKILIHTDMLTEPPTRQASPELKGLDESESRVSGRTSKSKRLLLPVMGEDEGDLLLCKAGVGGLIKRAKQNVQFDMSSFECINCP